MPEVIRMNLGDTIRDKRKKLSLTQSQLAEMLGVSTQAVSKWERGAGYPDVTQIVPLARILQVSTDALLDNKERYKELNHEWQIACCKYEGGAESIYTLIDLDEQALKEYPDDYTFLYRRVVDKFRAAMDEDDVGKKESLLLSCIGNARYALSKFPEDDCIPSTLARAYAARGDRDLALEYAYKTKNPQAVLKFVLTGDELRRHRQQLVSKKLIALLNELQDGGLDFLRAEEDIIHTLIPDGNYGWHYDNLAMVYIKRARIYQMSGKTEDAVAAIETAFSIAREKDETNGRKFTAVLFDMLDPEREDTLPLVDQLRLVCEHEKLFDPLRELDEYKKIL